MTTILVQGVEARTNRAAFVLTWNFLLSFLLCSLLQSLNSMPVLGDTAEAAALRERHVHGVTVDGKLWISHIVQYANVLLSHEKDVKAVTPFTKEQKAAWNR